MVSELLMLTCVAFKSSIVWLLKHNTWLVNQYALLSAIQTQRTDWFVNGQVAACLKDSSHGVQGYLSYYQIELLFALISSSPISQGRICPYQQATSDMPS